MVFILDYLHHRRDCKFKQSQRLTRLASLPSIYHSPLTNEDKETINAPIESLVSAVQNGTTSPLSILHTYGKIAVKAHARTNCVTEVLIPSAEEWISSPEKHGINLQGPLAGIPVSLKDTIIVGGYDTTVGYSSFVGNAQTEDGAMVKLLKDAGAVPYVKTNCPITLLSFESGNEVWGKTRNPFNGGYSPGGSTGGESALLALGGRIGVGSDVAGSVRLPAHWSGCWSLRCSTGRWPKAGIKTSMPGQEGVPSVYSPMARTGGDLIWFMRGVIGMKPWRYDASCVPLEWREGVMEEFRDKRLRVGVLRTDGVVKPSPACERGLRIVEEVLRRDGHEVEEIKGTPDMYEGLRLASLLLNADGCQMFESFRRFGEWNDSGARLMRRLAGLWAPLRWVYWAWVKFVRRDEVWAGLVRDWRPKSAFEQWKLVAEREGYRTEWFEWWNRKGYDVLISPPNATPALPHDGMKDGMSSCGYTFLFNLLDYSAGVFPVTHVDKKLDKLPENFNLKKPNAVARGAYKYYDAEKMHGLPVGVQVIGRRLEEEKVLAVMQRIEDALGENKYRYFDVYQNNLSFVPKYASRIMEWLDPQPDDRILDIGCGGVFTKVFSSSAMHWILAAPDSREPFFEGVRDALVPGGAFVFEMGGMGNISEMRAAVLSAVGRRVGLENVKEPWWFPDEEWVEGMLSKVGGLVLERADNHYLTVRADKGGVEGWVRLVGAQLFDLIGDEKEREACVREVVDVLDIVCKQPDGSFAFTYVRLRVVARKVSRCPLGQYD
ncbi:Acetamidase [Podospora fimiseda]|uniref:amidase n=1 Tax=Podospora fimiseda TaxID=252190 RepID=A0AAN7H2H9_9PEZI|nr:Acetamidase [Podospora fimiseda]